MGGCLGQMFGTLDSVYSSRTRGKHVAGALSSKDNLGRNVHINLMLVPIPVVAEADLLAAAVWFFPA